jgi:hypothetical protein
MIARVRRGDRRQHVRTSPDQARGDQRPGEQARGEQARGEQARGEQARGGQRPGGQTHPGEARGRRAGRRRAPAAALAALGLLTLTVATACSDAGPSAAAQGEDAANRRTICSQLLATTARITETGQLSNPTTAETAYRDGASTVRRIGHETDGAIREAADETALALDMLADQVAAIVPGRLTGAPNPQPYALADGRLQTACGA